jgi:PBP1b-binding outer membrane lipoprotein LpoB
MDEVSIPFSLKGQTMKRTTLIVALAALGLAGCNKEQPKPATAPAAPITSAPVTTPGPADAAKDTAKTSAEAPKLEAAKTEAGKDAKK